MDSGTENISKAVHILAVRETFAYAWDRMSWEIYILTKMIKNVTAVYNYTTNLFICQSKIGFIFLMKGFSSKKS